MDQMLRYGLSAYLMLAMLAGPLLCCCMPGHIAAAFSSNTESPDQPKKASHRKTCCSHHSRSKSPQPAAPSHEKGKPGHPTDSSCPCKKSTCPEIAIPAPEPESAKQLQARHLPRCLADLFPCPQALDTSLLTLNSPLGRDGACLLPFLTAEDLLHAFHILRC